MSVLAIVLIVLFLLLLGLFLGGLVVSRRRVQRPDFSADVRKADQALERARADDRGWDRELLDRAARRALEQEHPTRRWESLELVLVDDRPGVHEDRAHVVAVAEDGHVRVILARDPQGNWAAESLE